MHYEAMTAPLQMVRFKKKRALALCGALKYCDD
jgi:hypothetical protein